MEFLFKKINFPPLIFLHIWLFSVIIFILHLYDVAETACCLSKSIMQVKGCSVMVESYSRVSKSHSDNDPPNRTDWCWIESRF